MKYTFESKEREPTDMGMQTEQHISREQLKRLMLSVEVMANTMYPALRIHLKVDSE